MIKEIIMYTVICDHCGVDMLEGQEYSCWSDEDFAVEKSGCEVVDDNHYCENCYKGYDENDNIILDTTRKDFKNLPTP